MMSFPSGEVGQPAWLPDFVDPDDVGEASLDASATWGQEPGAGGRLRAGRVHASSAAHAAETGSAADEQRRERSGTRQAKRGRGTGRRRGSQLTWAEKRERREARAERRRGEEAAAQEKDPIGYAREIVLRQLSAAPRSRAALADKLREKGVSEDVIDAVLDRMEDVGLVDDEAYAGMLVRSQVASRGLARRALAQELRRRGVDDDVAREALEEVGEEDERRRAAELVRKKLPAMARLDEATQTRRLAGMLARKGYPASTVWSVLAEVRGAEPPESAL